MRAPLTIPLLHQIVRGAAYVMFQLALVLAFLLRSMGALRLPFRFHNADEESQDTPPTRRTLPSARLRPRPAL
ncbi:hypothetical protein MTX78_12620 [Hymenobacter tibetensis]|uniref:Uncharacterized protein n=1 Tax=Hymenobacter tibetensis TaxID=497967 RepID=A0ABY4CVD3_9BACT|nr:hypothetical protein [Hymenobacter tibetensis]UOG72971.1 hypothetical protein MTX78_12620 [Hymenobacter tibetensis]